MSQIDKRERVDSAGTVLHWYDFICPFCYVGQEQNAILTETPALRFRKLILA